MYAERVVTAEEFERMPDEPGVRMELVRGKVIRMSPPGFRQGAIASRLFEALAGHVAREGLGRVVLPVGFKVASNPDTVREPDLAFVSRDRLHGEPEGFFQGPPDLAVEVISPRQRRVFVDGKAAEYLVRGVRMVWVIDPKTETVTVHQPGSAPLVLREGALLEGGSVVPGFRCDLRAIFC